MASRRAILWARMVMISAREGQRGSGDCAFGQFKVADLVNEDQGFVVFDQEPEAGVEAALGG